MEVYRGGGARATEGNESMPDADLISIPDAARWVGVHVDTLYRLCRMGRFPPAIQVGSRWRVSVPRLERYLHEDSTEDS